eukprot:4424370-Amphidinium_carterae.1
MGVEVDAWCLPHPSLDIEKSTWSGDLSVIEPQFWRFLESISLPNAQDGLLVDQIVVALLWVVTSVHNVAKYDKMIISEQDA